MVSVRRCRRSSKNTPDRTVRRCKLGTYYTGRRCNRRRLYTGRRSKARVFLVSATYEHLRGPSVVAGQLVQSPPRHGVPARLIRAMAFYGFVNEPGFDQVALGTGDYVCAFPATLCQICSRRQKPPVVVAHELPGKLKQQSTRRMAQASVGGAIYHAPRQGYKPACVASRIALVATVATVSHACRRWHRTRCGGAPRRWPRPAFPFPIDC